VLYVLLRITDSDYPFGIFKLFLENTIATILQATQHHNAITSRWFYCDCEKKNNSQS